MVMKHGDSKLMKQSKDMFPPQLKQDNILLEKHVSNCAGLDLLLRCLEKKTQIPNGVMGYQNPVS